MKTPRYKSRKIVAELPEMDALWCAEIEADKFYEDDLYENAEDGRCPLGEVWHFSILSDAKGRGIV